MVENEVSVVDMRVLVEVIDSAGVEHRAAALDAVDDVSLAEQELGQVRAILAGHAGDEGCLHEGSEGLMKNWPILRTGLSNKVNG